MESPVPAEIDVFDGVAAVGLGDVFLTLWRAPARRERVRQVTRWAEAHIRGTTGTIAACQFLLPSASPPDAAAREEARLGFRVIEPSARRLVTVPLGDSVWLDVVRTIIRGAVALTPYSRLIKVAASEREAFDLLEQVATDRSPSRRQLEAGLGALRAALPPEPPR